MCPLLRPDLIVLHPENVILPNPENGMKPRAPLGRPASSSPPWVALLSPAGDSQPGPCTINPNSLDSWDEKPISPACNLVWWPSFRLTSAPRS